MKALSAIAALFCAGALGTAAPPAQAGGGNGAAGNGNADITYIANPPRRLLVPAARMKPGAFPTPSQCVASAGLACYTPALIRKAYNIPDASDGDGQTIVIVDAYGSPTVKDDLAAFSALFGLPPADIEVIYPLGAPAFNAQQRHGNEDGWAFETSLDVQWAHAIAPKAKIKLVIAPNNGGNALNLAQKFAIDNHLGQVMSLSFGADEGAIAGAGNNLQLLQAHANYKKAAAAGITVFASTGDGGATDGLAFTNALYPASDPLVTGVGGTSLFMADDGTYTSETTWNDDGAGCPFGCAYGPIGATGGAVSAIFTAPTYQSILSGLSMRSTSDVAYNAGVYTGVMVVVGFEKDPANNGLYFAGGTSAGAPQWAAITALVNQARGAAGPVGFFNPTLYAIGANPPQYAASFHDVTVGTNAFQGPGFPAGTGYDMPTGLGSPNVAGLLGLLTAP